MPYIVPESREQLEPFIEDVVNEISTRFQTDGELVRALVEAFLTISGSIKAYFSNHELNKHNAYQTLGLKIVRGISSTDSYEIRMGWAGDLNYCITRILILLPKKLMLLGILKKEFAYWMYACFVGALFEIANIVADTSGQDDIRGCLAGVFIDIKDEYKWRVNRAYERIKIQENGDCYKDAPFYTEE